MKKASIKEIAAKSGVSQSTVSRVFRPNPKYLISKRIQEKVRSTAKEIGYVPNHLAASLNKGSCASVGIILEDIENDLASPFLAQTLSGFIRHMDANGYGISFIPMPRRNGCQNLDREAVDELLVNTALSARVDGFFSTASMIKPATVDILSEHKIPLVLCNRFPGMKFSCNVVHRDYCKALQELIKIIANNNYKNLKYLTFNPQNSKGDRFYLFSELIAKRKALAAVNSFVFLGEPCTPMAYFPRAIRAIRREWEELKRADAIVCSNDLLALAACELMEAEGIVPGKDIAICGCDNIEDKERFFYNPPFLSTIDSCLNEEGAAAAELLLSQLREPDLPKRQITVEPRLIIRESLKPEHNLGGE